MIIGIVGFIGSGKGTAADILVNKHNFHKLSFADTVKDATAAIFGWPRNLLEGDTEESRNWREAKDEWWSEKFGYDISPRLALQMMGTEAGREVFHPDLWIHSLERKMEMYPNVVIADVRFPNEIDFIQSKGGFVVRVKRGPDPEWYDDAVIANSTFETAERYAERLDAINRMDEIHRIHYSEWAWIGSIMDYHLTNEGALSMLESDITHMLKVFSGPIVKNQAA
jgi:hypothetical protein